MINKSRVTKTKVLHNFRKGDGSNLNEEMNMVIHQAKCMHTMPIPLNALLNKQQKARSIGWAERKYIAPAFATHHHMIVTTGKVDSRFTSHGLTLSVKSPFVQPDPVINNALRCFIVRSFGRE